jgi:hypothetical protein
MDDLHPWSRHGLKVAEIAAAVIKASYRTDEVRSRNTHTLYRGRTIIVAVHGIRQQHTTK